MADRTIEILVKGAGAATGAGAGGGTSKAEGGKSLLDGILGGGLIENILGMTQGGKAGKSMANGIAGGIVSSGMLATIGVIAGGIMVIVSSSKSLMKVIGNFFRMIMLIIKPIGDVISVLLMPLIWMLMPLVKIMNMIFQPLRKYLMTALSSQKEAFMSGDPAEMLIAMMNSIRDSLGAWISTLISGKTFEEYSPERGFYNIIGQTETGEDIIETSQDALISGLWDKITGGVTNFFSFVTDPTKTIQLMFDVVIDLVIDFFRLVLGDKLVQDLFNTMFLLIKKFFNLILGDEDAQTIFNTLNESIAKFLGFTPPEEDDYASILYNALIVNVQILLAIRNPITAVAMLLKWETFTNAIVGLIEIYKPILSSWTTTITSTANSLGSAINGIIRYARNLVKSFFSGKSVQELETEDKVRDVVSAGVFGYQNVNDFVMTPTGSLIKTNPSDYLFGTKNPTGMSGKSINFEINIGTVVTNNLDDFKDKFDEILVEALRRYE